MSNGFEKVCRDLNSNFDAIEAMVADIFKPVNQLKNFYLAIFTNYEFLKLYANETNRGTCSKYKVSPTELMDSAEKVESHPMFRLFLPAIDKDLELTIVLRKIKIEDSLTDDKTIDTLTKYIGQNAIREFYGVDAPNREVNPFVLEAKTALDELLVKQYQDGINASKLNGLLKKYYDNYHEILKKLADPEIDFLKFMLRLIMHKLGDKLDKELKVLSDDKYFRKPYDINLKHIDELIKDVVQSDKIQGDTNKALLFLLKSLRNQKVDYACLFSEEYGEDNKFTERQDNVLIFLDKERLFYDMDWVNQKYRTDYWDTYGALVPKKGLMRDYCRDKKMIVIFLSIYDKDFAHQNVLVIDLKNKIVERFEPNGPDFLDDYDSTTVDSFMRVLTEKEFGNGYRYINPQQVCPRIFSGVQAQAKHLEEGGFCVTWSIMYAHARLMNPDVPPEVMNEAMFYKDYHEAVKYTPEELLDRVRRFQQHIDEVVNEEEMQKYMSLCDSDTENKILKQLNEHLNMYINMIVDPLRYTYRERPIEDLDYHTRNNQVIGINQIFKAERAQKRLVEGILSEYKINSLAECSVRVQDKMKEFDLYFDKDGLIINREKYFVKGLVTLVKMCGDDTARYLVHLDNVKWVGRRTEPDPSPKPDNNCLMLIQSNNFKDFTKAINDSLAKKNHDWKYDERIVLDEKIIREAYQHPEVQKILTRYGKFFDRNNQVIMTKLEELRKQRNNMKDYCRRDNLSVKDCEKDEFNKKRCKITQFAKTRGPGYDEHCWPRENIDELYFEDLENKVKYPGVDDEDDNRYGYHSDDSDEDDSKYYQ